MKGIFVQKLTRLIILTYPSRYIFDSALPACVTPMNQHHLGFPCLLDSTYIQQLHQQETREQEESTVRIFTLWLQFWQWLHLTMGHSSSLVASLVGLRVHWLLTTAPSPCPFMPRGGKDFSLLPVPDNLTTYQFGPLILPAPVSTVPPSNSLQVSFGCTICFPPGP